MENVDNKLLAQLSDHNYKDSMAYSIRKNGKTIDKKDNDNIIINLKENFSGLDITIKDDTKYAIVDIPVIITKSGLEETVYNDFHIGKNSIVYIVAGCGIHNPDEASSSHAGIHRFFVGENSKVSYTEKHYGEGNGKRILNPTTEIILEKNSSMEMNTVQIKGVDSSLRTTNAVLKDNTNLVISEKIMTHDQQNAKTEFEVILKGANASTKITSRSVATENSKQEFISRIIGQNKCYAHVECDGIIKDNAQIKASPIIDAQNVDANLIHEAAIGKIAGEQLIKLMSLGLSEKEAEQEIINGFLK